jgi:hypothetical protein
MMFGFASRSSPLPPTINCETMYGAPPSSSVSWIVTMCVLSPSRPNCLRFTPDSDEAVGIEAFGLDQRERDVALELGVVCEVYPLRRPLTQKPADQVTSPTEGCR